MLYKVKLSRFFRSHGTRKGYKKSIFLLSVLLSMTCAAGPEPMTLQFRLAQPEPGKGLMEATFEPTGEVFYLHSENLIDPSDIAAAKAMTWQGRQVVDLSFNETGKEKLARITSEHIGERIGILVDGRLVSAPTINAPILEGRAMIAGYFTEEQAHHMAAGIQAGLPSGRP
jgi:preprotein translocase subunit SecD